MLILGASEDVDSYDKGRMEMVYRLNKKGIRLGRSTSIHSNQRLQRHTLDSSFPTQILQSLTAFVSLVWRTFWSEQIYREGY